MGDEIPETIAEQLAGIRRELEELRWLFLRTTGAEGSPGPTRYLSPQEAARRVHLSPKTLTNWAGSGKGPVYVRIGDQRLYPEDEFERWLEAQPRYRNTAEEAAAIP